MKISFGVKLAVSAFIIGLIFYRFDIKLGELFTQFTETKYLLIALTFPLCINHIITNNRWKLLLSSIGVKESFWTLVKINLSSTFVGLALPSSQGYDAIRIYKIEKLHPENKGVGCTVVIERIIGLVCLCSIGIVASLFIDVLEVKMFIYVFSFIVASAIFILFNERCYSYLNKIISSFNRFKRIFTYLAKLHEATYSFPLRKNIVGTVLLILLFQFNNILVVYLLFKATGTDIPLVYHLVAMPVISIISLVPITISGIGVRDGAFVFMYAFVGISHDVIVGVSIVNYIIISLLPAFIGSFFYLSESLRHGHKK